VQTGFYIQIKRLISAESSETDDPRFTGNERAKNLSLNPPYWTSIVNKTQAEL